MQPSTVSGRVARGYTGMLIAFAADTVVPWSMRLIMTLSTQYGYHRHLHPQFPWSGAAILCLFYRHVYMLCIIEIYIPHVPSDTYVSDNPMFPHRFRRALGRNDLAVYNRGTVFCIWTWFLNKLPSFYGYLLSIRGSLCSVYNDI